MEQLATAETELTELEGAEGDLAALTENRLNVHESLGRAAAELTRLRVSAAGRLSSLATALLPSLGLPAGVLHVSVESGAGIEASGSDTVSFKVQLNVGHEARDLARVASGGELSRVMLAVKSILAAVDRVPALIFDEVDAGIGGETALRVGDALRELAARHQVLVITHLPQIAARAHHHLIVRKQERAGVATAEVEVVDGRNRVAEIARMLAGDPSSKTGLKHARELLDSAASGETR
jgi:DNA repair protein RecN (Recombination protein N)